MCCINRFDIESGKKIQEEELERRAAVIREEKEEREKRLKPFIDEENKKVEKALILVENSTTPNPCVSCPI